MISSRAASRQLLPADFLRRGRGDDFFEPRIARELIPKWQQLQVAIAEIGGRTFGSVSASQARTACGSVGSTYNFVRVFD
jgi:hypothetical protein